MDAQWIRNQVKGIETMARSGDFEKAHSREDELTEKVLRAIADEAKNAQELAQAVIKSYDLEFDRWCA